MQQDVADACGLSTAQANRTIPELRRRELIEWNGHAVDFLRDRITGGIPRSCFLR
ncbi:MULTISPECIES: hypothetical protein [Bradyrhizobium]|uniref:hypothetical protein n=1 Tax=Bradyrhizobium TaxID=374 RepID=UPI00209D9A39|nr:hypothetical protein [Bradyrhizobium elkanii]WLA46513.1 hypothetical protein QIH80_32830 [Bradyrhizobium elkanii]WLB83202.1 hypothetical protein QIH83_11930 [Bradyrhizobium elkanii]